MSIQPTRKESKEAKQQRLANQRGAKESRASKTLLRKEDEKHHHIKLINLFAEFGVSYETYGKESWNKLQVVWDGRRAEELTDLTEGARQFLKENFQTRFQADGFGFMRLKFVDILPHQVDGRTDTPGKLILHLAKESGQPYSVVNSIYQSLIALCRKQLAKRGRFRIPNLGQISVRYRPAQAEHQGRNPATGEALTIKAKPARNRLHFHASKTLAEWVDKTIPVVPPTKKRHKAKEKKRKRKKHYKSHFDEQKHFHIA